MAVTPVREFKVKMNDGTHFYLYSDRDLTNLDSTLHYCVSIRPTGRGGLGLDEHKTFDGAHVPAFPAAPPADCSLPKAEGGQKNARN